MSKNSKDLTRILISLIFLAYGIDGFIAALQSLADFNIAGVLACALGVLMFITGILGLCRKNKVCRILGVIICVLSAAQFVMGLLGLSFGTQLLVQALLAWIYFDVN
ncbi:MAG: hypothetical protein E7664_02850 [Ruminococcaceae bacterium]|nr:hypothetical protein [Oscillospiraceae bacterium]